MMQDILFEKLVTLCQKTYRENLVSVAVFGSVGRNTARPDSDIDILLVIKGLSHWRM